MTFNVKRSIQSGEIDFKKIEGSLSKREIASWEANGGRERKLELEK